MKLAVFGEEESIDFVLVPAIMIREHYACGL